MIIWDKEKTDRIFEMRQQGITYQEIAQEFGTNAANISAVITRMRQSGYEVIKANPWTPLEEEELLALRVDGKNNKEISEILGKSHDSVKKKASALIKAGALNRAKPGALRDKCWTPESINKLIELRTSKTPVKDIAEILGIGITKVKLKIKELVSTNDISRLSGVKLNLPEEELLDAVRKYVSYEACPTSLASNIKRVFGSWTKALEAAGISGNIGGKFDPNRTTRVYLLDFGDFYKIGITQQQIKSRFSGAPRYTILDYIETDLDNAVYLEKELKKAVRPYQYVAEHPWFERNGKTECFKTDQPIRYIEDIFAP